MKKSRSGLSPACSTGFGRELVLLLRDQGFRVAATARDVSKIQDLAAGHEETILTLPLDVRDKTAVDRAVKEAEAKFGQIDVLVNNAGYGYLAAIEEGEDDAVREMFDTNVFGLVDVTKAVLPGCVPAKADILSTCRRSAAW